MSESKTKERPDLSQLEEKLKKFLDAELGVKPYLAIISVLQEHNVDQKKQTISLQSTQTRVSNLDLSSPYFIVVHLKDSTLDTLNKFFSGED